MQTMIQEIQDLIDNNSANEKTQQQIDSDMQ